MTLAVTYYGAASIGASSQNPVNVTAYAVPVSVTADGLAVAIEIGITGGVFTPAAMLLADNGGQPGDIVAVFQVSSSLTPSATARFFVAPVMAWVTAGDYWIAFQHSVGGGGAQLRYTTGSLGDGYEIDGAATALQEPGSSGTTLDDTDRQYSLRLAVITEVAGASEGSATGTIAWAGSATGEAPSDAQQGTATGTITWAGTATGTNVRSGAATGTITWAGSAIGSQTVPGAAPPSLVDGGLRFEAWTDPNVGPFARKFDLSRHVVGYTVADKYSSISDGEFDLPSDFAKRDLLFKVDKANHANDIGSIIRVLDGTTPELHYVLKKMDGRWSSTGQPISAKLEGMDYFLDKALVPNFDAPVKPYVEPDWHYGLPSILFNTDFEDGGLTNIRIHVWLEDAVTAGTWTMTFDAQTTSALAWNIDAPALQTAIEALSNIVDISIAGDGTELNPWVIEVIDPAGTDFNVSTNPAGLTGGVSQILSIVQGGAGIADPWTRSLNPLTGLPHGLYTNFDVSTVQAHTGTSSLYVKGSIGGPDSWPGAQQIVSVTGGRTYRAAVWVYPLFARKYRFVIRTTDETFIGMVEADLTAGSWQQLSMSVTIPNHVRSIIFRLSCISNTDGHEFYLDDALLAPGADAATYGKIMGQLLTACQAAGYLTWVTKTWSDTLDSAGVAWDQDRIWSVRHRQSLLQLVEYADRWNYESDGIHWNIANDRFEWGLYNPSGGGADRQNTGLAIIGKIVGETGTVSEERPDATQFYAEGDLGYWNEYEDATLAGAWGPLQKSFFNAQGLDTAALLELATRLVADAGNRTAGLVTRLQAAPVKPWRDFKPGDRNIMVNLSPIRPREYLRCMAIVATKRPGQSAPTYEAHWGSVVYQGQAAVLETVRRLVRKFEAQRPTSNLDGRPTVAIPPPDTARGGIEDASWVFAALDSSTADKARADQVCSGVDDEITIRDAILANLPNGGQIGFLPGRYKFGDELTNADRTSGLNLNRLFDKPLRFRGSPGVVFEFAANPLTASSFLIRCGPITTGSDLPIISFDHIRFDGGVAGSGYANADGVLISYGAGEQARFVFTNCLFYLWDGDHVLWGERHFAFNVGQCFFSTCRVAVSFFHVGGFSDGMCIVHDNDFFGCTGVLWTGAGFSLGGIFTDNNFSSGMTIPTADPFVDVHHNRISGVKVPGDHAGASSGMPGGKDSIDGFRRENLAANLTASQLERSLSPTLDAALPVVVTHAGSIVGISAASTEARTVGTATFEVYKNGAATGLTCVLNGTNTQFAFGVQAVDLDTVAAGGRLDVRVTTSSDWAPTTADVEAVVVLQYDPA